MSWKQHWYRILIPGSSPVVFLWLLLALAGQARAADSVFCVAPPDTGSPASGAPCDARYSTVQAAVDAASGGEEILVAGGVYTDVHGRTGITQVVFISTNVTIRGGYTPAFDQAPDPAANPTRLTPDGIGRVVVVSPTVEVTLNGLQLTGGRIGVPEMVQGAGVLNYGVLTLTNVLVDDHNTGAMFGSGAGVYNATGAQLAMVGSTVSNGATFESSGGGIYNEGIVDIRESAILSNANLGFFGPGAGIGNAGKLTIDNSLIANNSGASAGAGLANYAGGVVRIGYSTVTTNAARGAGGGLDNKGDMVIVNTTIANNSVDVDAMTGCCIDGGGGIANSGSLMALNATIAGNNVLTGTITGGGIYNTGILTLTNVIVAGNVQAGIPGDCAGGGVYNLSGVSLTSPTTGCPAAGTVVYVAASDVFSTVLAPLANNGGSTPTFGLREDSPAIDSAADDMCPADDQRGMPRPVGLACDIGAFEFGGTWYWLPLVARQS